MKFRPENIAFAPAYELELEVVGTRIRSLNTEGEATRMMLVRLLIVGKTVDTGFACCFSGKSFLP